MQNLLLKLLRESHIFHLKEKTLGLQLKSHPNPTSIKAVSDTLDYFGVENLVVNVPKDALSQLPQNFLALLQDEKVNELVFVKVNKNDVLLFTETNKKFTKTIKDFKEAWTGTIIALEPKEPNYRTSFAFLKTKKDWLLVFGLILLGISAITIHYPAFFYTCINSIGILISVLIVREEIGLQTTMVTKLCSAITEKSNCTAIIQSKSNRFLNFIKPSDASIIYFVSSFLISTFIGFNHSYFLLVAYIGLIPAILSLYYQGFVLKKWCALCLGISILLVAQFCLLFFTGKITNIFLDVTFLIKAFGLLLGTAGLWSYLKLLLHSSMKLASVDLELLKFKRSEGVFDFLVNQKKLPNPEPIFISDRLVFGNRNASISIKAVTNPLCGYCTESFEVYDQILATHANDINIELIFNVADDLQNQATQISLRIIEIYIVSGPEEAFNALKNWFLYRDIEKWQKKFGKVEVIEDYYISILKSHISWCKRNQIDYTPATLLGDNFFPNIYKITDLSFFIDDKIRSIKEEVIEQ